MPNNDVATGKGISALSTNSLSTTDTPCYDNISQAGSENLSYISDDIQCFNKLREENINNPIFTYYNINSLRHKIHDVKEVISRSLPDIMILAETKIDESFPTSKFLINEYNEPTRSNRSAHGGGGGGVIEYVRRGIIRNRLKDFELKYFESICSEISVRNTKWFLLSVYRSPNSSNITDFFFVLNQILNRAVSKYDNMIIMGDFNIDIDDQKITGFEELKTHMVMFDLTNLIKTKTCITWGHESLLDIILTNKPNHFMHSSTLELGISDFHKMSVTILKSQVARMKPKIISFRSYKKFNEEKILQQ